MNMDFGENETPVEVIKEEAFGGIYVRDIYSGVNGKWYRKPWKDKIIIAQIIMMLMLINIVLNVRHH